MILYRTKIADVWQKFIPVCKWTSVFLSVSSLCSCHSCHISFSPQKPRWNALGPNACAFQHLYPQAAVTSSKSCYLSFCPGAGLLPWVTAVSPPQYPTFYIKVLNWEKRISACRCSSWVPLAGHRAVCGASSAAWPETCGCALISLQPSGQELKPHVPSSSWQVGSRGHISSVSRKPTSPDGWGFAMREAWTSQANVLTTGGER